MKNILILASNFGKKKEIFESQLKRELGLHNASLTIAKFDDVFIDLENKEIKLQIDGHNVKEFDCVYFRRVGPGYSALAGTIALILDFYKIQYFDSTWKEIGPMGNKLTSLTKLFIAGVPIPRTMYHSQGQIPSYYEELRNKLGNVLIAKDLDQQRGRGIYLIKNLEDFALLENKEISKPLNQFMFQEYIENPKEYRLLVLGNKVGVWEEKIPQKGEFRSNVSLGAKEVFYPIADLPEDFKSISVKAAKCLGIEIAGVDIMQSRDITCVLEVNRGPGFTYDNNESSEITNLAKFLSGTLPSTSK